MRLRRGFTLIELIIFTAIFAVAMGAFMSVFTDVTRVAVRQGGVAEVQSQSQFLLQTIQRYVERSSLIAAEVDTPSASLTLRMSTTDEDPVIIDMNGAAVQLRVGASVPHNITSDRVEVTNLLFTLRSNPGSRDSLSVSFTITYASTNPSQRWSESLRTTISRNAAAEFDSSILPGTGSSYGIGSIGQSWRSINNTIFFNGNNNVGISDTPFAAAAPLHVQGEVLVDNGDLRSDYAGHGTILRSPNGSCWRLTANDHGNIVSNSTACP